MKNIRHQDFAFTDPGIRAASRATPPEKNTSQKGLIRWYYGHFMLSFLYTGTPVLAVPDLRLPCSSRSAFPTAALKNGVPASRGYPNQHDQASKIKTGMG
ncbi:MULTISPECIES: hypothetical protein [unclassified Polaromonas]|uniref:hypothetical protein n=1 Tax=unclassified Polaromonas TaxID=2638319 RepID=UPI0018CB54B7|nr:MULTISPECIES: hypothetical protein [unclassified Polaromonas]MBG6070550.1 hypothetical protein [Polaromonas sp. CG_9.7]MDH6184198.1 hypothetical protein [Polaromonas sp. CG_23.6]